MNGFFPPGSPNADARVFARPDGSLDFVVLPRIARTDTGLDLKVYLAKELGREVNLMAEYGKGSYLFELPNDDGSKRIVFRSNTRDLLIYPGTYTIRILKDGVEVFTKSLTVSNHPALP